MTPGHCPCLGHDLTQPRFHLYSKTSLFRSFLKFWTHVFHYTPLPLQIGRPGQVAEAGERILIRLFGESYLASLSATLGEQGACFWSLFSRSHLDLLGRWLCETLLGA